MKSVADQYLWLTISTHCQNELPNQNTTKNPESNCTNMYLSMILSTYTNLCYFTCPHIGLNSIFSYPEETLSVDSFAEGATHPVNATFSASCCVREAEVVGRDMLGNIGKCEWDLGSLTGKNCFWYVPQICFDCFLNFHSFCFWLFSIIYSYASLHLQLGQV